MTNKVTAKDIAIEAGVSVATVSYILNDRKDVKISEATRRKVLQICNLRQYAPSQVAKSLATGKNNMIGLQFNLLNSSFSRNQHIIYLLKEVQSKLQALNYDTLIMPSFKGNGDFRVQRNIDAIICFDLPENEFNELKESYFVPIILINMVLQDPIFYRSFNDISDIVQTGKSLLGNAKVNFIMERYQNNLFMQYAEKSLVSDSFFIADDYDKLRDFLTSRRDDNFIIYDEFLAPFCLQFISNEKTAVVCNNLAAASLPNTVKKILLSADRQADTIIDMLLCAIERKAEKPHEIRFLSQK